MGGQLVKKTHPLYRRMNPPESKMHPLDKFLFELGLFATNLQSQRIAGFFNALRSFPAFFRAGYGPNGKAADLTEREKSDGLNIFLFSS